MKHMENKTALQQLIEWGDQMLKDHPNKLLSFAEAIDKAEKLLSIEQEQSELKVDKITRLEVINHAKNDKSIGRLLTMYKELNDFNSIELSFQDGGRTLKIFIN